jgi:hypothetical protein
MSTQTTAEIIAEHAQEQGVAVYYSKSTNLRLVRRPKLERINSISQIEVAQEPLRYLFAPEGTIVVYEGQDILPDGPGGAMQDAVAWLDNHKNLNTLFWREGAEPDRALPTEQDFLAQVNQALVARDVETIKALLAAEDATHQRKVLVDSAVSALTALRDAGEDISDPEPAVMVTGLEGLDRIALVQKAMEVGLEVPESVTDDQLRSALLVAGVTA